MNHFYLRMAIFCFIVVGSLAVGCGGGGGSSGGSDVSKRIGPDGGTLEITDENSPLYGVRLDIPAGALEAETEITIVGADDPSQLPENYLIAGSSIQLRPEGLTFLLPITLTLPYDDQDNDGLVDNTSASEDLVTILFADEKNASWELFETINLDTDQNLLSAKTDHFSTYLSAVNPTSSDGGINDPTVTSLVSGEHMFANPSYSLNSDGTSTIIRQKSPYYHLSVLRLQTNIGLVSVLDQFLTRTGYGADCLMAEDFLSCTFDAQAVFSKVEQSGDAALWDWNCEFVDEYTELRSYEVLDDALAADSTDTTDNINCSITTVDESSVTITWGINADQEVFYYNTDMIAIRLWANFQ